MKLHTILVPVDSFEEAYAALEVAALLARRSNATLLLLHIIDMPVIYESVYEHKINTLQEAIDQVQFAYTYLPQMVAKAKENVQKLVDQYPDLHIRKQLVFDEFAKDPADFITNEDADLIVLGACNQEDILLRQIEEKIIRRAKVPVLIVRGNTASLNFGHIVFASNFKNISGKTIDRLKIIQRFFGAIIHFVKIIPPKSDIEWQKENLDIVSGFATYNNFLNYTANIYAGENKELAIKKFAASVNAGLIAMVNSDRNGLTHFLFGNLTEKIAKTADGSVLTLSQ